MDGGGFEDVTEVLAGGRLRLVHYDWYNREKFVIDTGAVVSVAVEGRYVRAEGPQGWLSLSDEEYRHIRKFGYVNRYGGQDCSREVITLEAE